MPEKDPENVNWFFQTIPFFFVVFMAIIGGSISYLNKIKSGLIKFNLFKFLLENATSAFVGIITFLLCDTAGLDWEYTAALGGIAGSMGARMLVIFEDVIPKIDLIDLLIEFLEKIKERANGNSKRKTETKKSPTKDAEKPHER